MITEPQNRWIKQVRAKYKFVSWLHPTRRSNVSSYWRFLFGPSITKQLHAVIVNGDDIHFWNDSWSEALVLSRSALEVRWESSELFTNLRDFITDGSWNRRRLEGILGPCVEQLASKGPISSELHRDTIVWGPDFKIRPKVRDIYKHFRFGEQPLHGNASNSPLKYSTIWKLPVAPSIRLFIWKLHVGPTQVFISRFGLSNGQCPFCVNLETLDHLFFECWKTVSIWDFISSRWSGVEWPRNLHECWDLLSRRRLKFQHAALFSGRFGRTGTGRSLYTSI